MTIQEPGISKYCDTCGREYLKEEFVLKDEAESDVGLQMLDPFPYVRENGDETKIDGESGRPLVHVDPVSLAHILFKVHDVCLFCGGKFIG